MQSKPPHETFESDSKTILVVDDVESIRNSLRYMLAKKGYRVLTAENGSEALEILNRVKVDLVISDIAMPVLDGIQLVKQIKEQYRPPEILLITGEPSLETATSAVRLGIFDYISKPLQNDVLMTTVHRALEKKMLLDEKERLERQNQRYLRDLEEKFDEKTYRLIQTEERYRNLFENSNVGIGVITAEGEVLEINDTICQLTGYSPEAFKKISFSSILVKSKATHDLLDLIKQGTSVDDFEVNLMKANKSTFWVSLSLKTIRYGSLSALLITIIDITDRKEYEEGLKKALADKEVMLREIHHRTKNNMNVIISILNMQSYSVEDQAVKDILRKVNDRIYSMSLVHEQVYASEELASIDLSKYIKSLYMRHYGMKAKDSREIKVTLDLSDVSIGLSQAIPLGLALNEVISNIVKHPFKDTEGGEVIISLKKLTKRWVQITVRDNGCGFPEEFDLSDPGTLGLHMAKILIQDQLDGQFVLKSDQGVLVEIQFPLAGAVDNPLA